MSRGVGTAGLRYTEDESGYLLHQRLQRRCWRTRYVGAVEQHGWDVLLKVKNLKTQFRINPPVLTIGANVSSAVSVLAPLPFFVSVLLEEAQAFNRHTDVVNTHKHTNEAASLFFSVTVYAK